MQTITNIIEFENQIFKENVTKEYNSRKSNYDNEVFSVKKECSDKKTNKYDKENEVIVWQNKFNLEKKKLQKFRLNMIAFFLIACFGSYIIFSIWWKVPGWTFTYSSLGIAIAGIFIKLVIDPFKSGKAFTLNKISQLKVINEKLELEILELENQLETLRLNPPKLEDVEKIYNTRDFFEKISSSQSRDKFSVVLISPGLSLLTVVKMIKDIVGIGLKEAKNLVEASPSVLLKGVWEYEAIEIKVKLEEEGAKVEIVKQS